MGVQGDAFDAILDIHDALKAAGHKLDETREWIPATRDKILEIIQSQEDEKGNGLNQS